MCKSLEVFCSKNFMGKTKQGVHMKTVPVTGCGLGGLW